jgi:hypothetical protein
VAATQRKSLYAGAAARVEFGFCQHAASRAVTLLEREGGQSLSGLAAACSNSTWMEWGVVEPTGAAQKRSTEECRRWGAVSRTGAPNSMATLQDGHTGAPRRWSDRLRFLPALHKWVVASLPVEKQARAKLDAVAQGAEKGTPKWLEDFVPLAPVLRRFLDAKQELLHPNSTRVRLLYQCVKMSARVRREDVLRSAKTRVGKMFHKPLAPPSGSAFSVR